MPAEPGAGEAAEPMAIDLSVVAPEDRPEVLAAHHARLPVGARASLHLGEDAGGEAGGYPVADLIEGGGFTLVEETGPTLVVRRERTLPDRVTATMRLLVCGLNPSVYSADAGMGFARPGNRFWPAARAAGLVTAERDPDAALHDHGVGMTDLVKRATPRADVLTGEEYRAGLTRVTRLVAWLRPPVVCFVGLTGWRAAADRTARAGWQPERLAGAAVYLMGSTSGLNAHADLAQHTAHLRAAAAGPETGAREG